MQDQASPGIENISHTMPGASGFLARISASLVGMIALVLVAGLWLVGDHSAYDRLLTFWGMRPFSFPFVDVSGSLAAWECARKGVDVIVADPCDVLHRPYNYSPFWMDIAWIPLGQLQRVEVGLALGIGFLISLAALPPPLSRSETALRILASLSTMVVFAIERANPDMLMFILVIVALALLQRSVIARVLGYCVMFLAGAIKYYPFVLLVLVAKERLRVAISIVLASVVGLVLFWHIYAAKILEGYPYIAHGSPFGDLIAASNLPIGMAQIVGNVTNSVHAATIAAMLTAVLLPMLICAMLFVFGLRTTVPAALHRLDEPRRLALLAGALLLAGCFFTGQSVGYRGIFLLPVLPGLFALGRDNASGPMAFTAWLAAISIPPLMWAEGVRFWIYVVATGQNSLPDFISVPVAPLEIAAWCVRELLWSFLIALLVTIILGFVVDKLRPQGIRDKFLRTVARKVAVT